MMVKKGDEDYDEARDEGGFSGGGTGQACGLELITGGKEKADDEAGDEGRRVMLAQLTVVNDGQSDEGQGHAEEIEEQGRSVLEGVLDEDERYAPDGHDCQKQDMGESGRTETMGQSILPVSGLDGVSVGVDDFSVENGAEDLVWRSSLRVAFGDVVVEDDEVS